MRGLTAGFVALGVIAANISSVKAETGTRLELGFRRMYELKFEEARTVIIAYRRDRPEDPLGVIADAASYLFEEFNAKGVLTSAFFLDDKRLLGGIEGPPDSRLSAAFLEANKRARQMAQQLLAANPSDTEALFALTLAYGMQSDFEALIQKRQLASLTEMRRAENEAARLLKLKPDQHDAYVAIGAANYIIGCVPAYKRIFLWFGGFHGDRQRGMEQLEKAAQGGHYLKPLAMVLLALAAEREGQFDRARSLFEALQRDFPDNPLFARELALAKERSAGKPRVRASIPAQFSIERERL